MKHFLARIFLKDFSAYSFATNTFSMTILSSQLNLSHIKFPKRGSCEQYNLD